jgi:vancomycin resistance protein YoaR
VPRLVRYALLGLVALILLSMVLDAAVYANKIHAGVTIEGLSVSGLTGDEAESILNQYVERIQSNPIALTSGEKAWEVLPSSIGVKIDVAGAVAAAMDVTRENNHIIDLVTKLRLYFGGRDIPLEGSVNTAGLESVVDQIAEELDQPAVNAALLIRGGRVSDVEGKDGLIVDREALGRQLAEILLSLHSTELAVPMVVQKPEVTAEDNEAAFDQTRTMINSPLTLTSGENTWTFSTRELANYIDFTSEDVNGVSTLVPYLSAEKMAARFDEIAAYVAVEPANATFDSDGKTAWVVPGVEGKALAPDKTAEALTKAALTTNDRIVEAVTMAVEPELSTAKAESLGIKDLLASYKTSHWCEEARQHNVRLTTEYATAGENGILAPGEAYSFKEAVGPRTYARGFKKALGIEEGMALEYVYGGGICQVSTTMFNAVLEAGLQITERRNHTIYFEHYPRGRDATVTDYGPDLKFVNDTGHYVMLTGESDGIRTTIYVYGTDDGRKVNLSVSDWYGVFGPYTQTTLDATLASGTTIVIDEGAKGKMCMLTRIITWPDGRTKKDQFESFYRTQPRIVLVGTGTTTTTLAPPTTAAPPTTGSP